MLLDILIMFGVLIPAMMSPGPDMMLVMRYALSSHPKAAFFCALGIACGLMLHVLFSLLGLTALLAANATAYHIAKLIGAGYLIWLGYKIITAPADFKTQTAAGTITRKEAFMRGFLTNITNPKVMMFIFALFTQVIDPGYGITQKLTFAILLFFAVWLGWAGFAQLIRLRFILKALQKHEHRLNIVFGGLIIGLGILLAVSI